MKAIRTRTQPIQALLDLEAAAIATESRPTLIRNAREAGAKWPEIAEAAHLGIATVQRMAKIDADE